MNTDHDVRELLERMAREPAIGPVDPEPIVRRAHRRLARTVVLGFACVALLAGVAIGGANLVLSSPTVPATPNGDLPQILRDGEVMIQNFGSGQLEALDPSTGDRRTILDCEAAAIRAEDQCGRLYGYAISADGRWLAYYLGCGGFCPPGTGLWVTNALGEKQILTEGGNGQPWAWSPQGSTLAAFGDGEGLLTIDPGTGDRTTVATRSFVSALAWSPDGTGIVYATAELSPAGNVVYATARLESVDLESGEINRAGRRRQRRHHRLVARRVADRVRRLQRWAVPHHRHEPGRIGSARPRRSRSRTKRARLVPRWHRDRVRGGARTWPPNVSRGVGDRGRRLEQHAPLPQPVLQLRLEGSGLVAGREPDRVLQATRRRTITASRWCPRFLDRRERRRHRLARADRPDRGPDVVIGTFRHALAVRSLVAAVVALRARRVHRFGSRAGRVVEPRDHDVEPERRGLGLRGPAAVRRRRVLAVRLRFGAARPLRPRG